MAYYFPLHNIPTLPHDPMLSSLQGLDFPRESAPLLRPPAPSFQYGWPDNALPQHPSITTTSHSEESLAGQDRVWGIRRTLLHQLQPPSELPMRALPKIDRRLSDWLSNSLRFALGPVEPDAKLHDIPATISPKVLDARTYDLAQAEVTTVQPDCSSNQDAEGDRVWVESSEDDDSDDEYVPPTMPSLTQRRSYRKAKAAVAASSTGVMPSYSPPQTPRTSRPTQLARTSDTSRSSAHGTAPTATKRRCARGTGEPNFDSIDEKRNYVCLTCSRRFRGDRHADFKRHVMGHYPDKAFGKLGTVTCCGVPVESRDKYRVPASASTEYFEGLPMVGGCGKRFSRNDSLRRHLANPKTGCVGDLNGEWHLSKNKE